MTAREVFDKACENWQAKILCFVVALLLCMGKTFSNLDRKTFVVPLDVVSTGMVCPTSKAPEFVKITIRSTQENIAEVLPSDLSASLDLTYLSSDGEYFVPVTVKLSPKVLMMDSFEVRMKPERVPMKVEQKIVKYVKVKPSLVGDASYGYAITETVTEPDYIQVSGPRTAVAALDGIRTEMVDVTDLMFPEDFTVALQEVNSLLKVNAASNECVVHITVAPQSMTRTFLGIAVKAVNLNSSFELVSDILPVTFDVEGTVPSLENFSLGENAVTVDCAVIKAAGSYSLPVKISLPYPLKIQSRSTDNVRVNVRLRAEHNEAAVSKEGAA